MSGMKADRVSYTEEFIYNSRGTRLFTCRWIPLRQDVKGLVFLCHGYGMECSRFMKGTGQRLSRAGYAVFGIDYEGHGRSEGRRCYIRSFDYLVDDCIVFFKNVREWPEYRRKPCFLYGESMGGAVALLVQKKTPGEWNGAILVAPMCKISKNMKPHPLLIRVLVKLARTIPTWKVVPIKDVIGQAFKDPVKREEIRDNPYVYQGRPRLRTAVEMLYTSLNLECQLHEVKLPFLVLHGENDVVTDPAISQELYDSAGSLDKAIKIYPGMWHGLTSGEPDENIDMVFEDIVTWLDMRCPPGSLAASPIRFSDIQTRRAMLACSSPLRLEDAHTRQPGMVGSLRHRHLTGQTSEASSVPASPMRLFEFRKRDLASSPSVPASPMRDSERKCLRWMDHKGGDSCARGAARHDHASHRLPAVMIR
ncbi:caffeoylshikimate esterase isoform X1 [Selaginella moellendorffii]|nr:caffeoylshikimate esterase isoform X1 [Selaginella moellendorffii]|eukprot:XP_002977997.2 caffeoylshikimate esterase isoform X1 [Selaginella moellendorffii]